MASVRGIHRNSLTLGTGALSSTASPYLRTCPQHTMLRQKRTCGLRMTRCASGSPSASWPGLACWLNHTSHDVEGMMKQGAQGFKKFWADYKEKYDTQGKEEWPQVTREESTGYFSDAIVGQALRVEVVKYGEMVQAVYDTLETKDINSQFFGNIWPDVMEVGQPLAKYDDMGLITLRSEDGRQYKVVSIIEADSGSYKLIRKDKRNYVGFIAEGPPDEKGGVDIAVVFRGTITRDEWVQDAKALQVCWNHGRPVLAYPRAQLDGMPFDFSWQWFTLPFLALQLGLSLLSQPPPAASELWSAPLIAPTLADSPKLAGLLTWLLAQDEDLQHTIFCVLAAGLIWLVQGVRAGWTKYPKKMVWWCDLLQWLCAIPQWSFWGTVNVLKTVFDSADAHISFGFKEMYTEAQKPLKDSGPASPRLTVLTTLADLLDQYQSRSGQRIKSITMTGHSLGGALASLCAWDIGTTFNDAKAMQIGVKSGAAKGQNLYDRTDQQRARVMAAVKKLHDNKVPLPAVAAVTFAAPRVGNRKYATGFKSAGLEDQPGQVGMLRVVNAPDIVPQWPKSWYVHGGHELRLNYNDVPYFTEFEYLQGLGARHNHEMYLHLLDPARDVALVNKTDHVLVPGKKVPGCWWNPVPNSSMIEEAGKWMKAESPRAALQWHAARRP